MSEATVALLPTMPPESARVEIPASMNTQDREKLIGELSQISTEIARVQTRDEERAKFLDQRFRAIDARLAKLEDETEQTGRHDLVLLQKQLDKREAEFSKWKSWALSIVGALITSTIIGLVVHYFATKG